MIEHPNAHLPHIVRPLIGSKVMALKREPPTYFFPELDRHPGHIFGFPPSLYLVVVVDGVGGDSNGLSLSLSHSPAAESGGEGLVACWRDWKSQEKPPLLPERGRTPRVRQTTGRMLRTSLLGGKLTQRLVIKS